MSVEVKVPGVGESVQEGMIESWHKEDGDFVKQDDVILEIETDKATVEVVAEVSGTLKILAAKGKVVKVGEVIAEINETVGAGEATKKRVEISTTEKLKESVKVQAAQPKIHPLKDNGPAVHHKVMNEKLNISNLLGSGRDGRITKEDLMQAKPMPREIPKSPMKVAPAKKEVSFSHSSRERQDLREPMSMLRRRVSERLLYAQQNAAILTTFNEVDLSAIIDLRSKYKDLFEKRYGVKLGFMSFFLKASCYALEKYPRVNAYIEGDDIVYHNYCDIGVAVSTEKGLLVPIIRDVQEMNLAEIEMAIANYADKARSNKISLDDLKGGTFTVSNGGVFGSLLSTPILNPPQSAILGMHKMEDRPVVTADKKIEARPMMYVALSYDHRIIDGKESVGFLLTIKNCLEDPARLLIGV